MSKHLKLFSALLVLMVLAPISVFVFPSNAEAARSLEKVLGGPDGKKHFVAAGIE